MKDSFNDINLPLVAIVGRPNVGKSTFVNRITGKNEAIVHEMRGVTRDRSYHEAEWNGINFRLIDTGGIEFASKDQFQGQIKQQAILSTEESDVIVFIVDGRCGIQNDDYDIARILKKNNKEVMLIVNKVDNPNSTDEIWEFYNLGLGEPFAISALHGHGTGDFLDILVSKFQKKQDTEIDTSIKIAIIGRPNAGKSSLTNCLTGENRSIVSDIAGTTRDSIDTFVSRNNRTYRIIDTAGIRKKSSINEDVEYYSFLRALRAVDKANVVILVIDSTIGLTDQDQKLAGLAKEKGCSLVVVLNKWDIVGNARVKEEVRVRTIDRMKFVSYADIVLSVALTGRKLQNIWASIDKSYDNYCKQISTNQLNNWLIDIKENGYTICKGKKVLRFKYITQTGVMPPRFTIFVNYPSLVTDNYCRFLENKFRSNFNFDGSPVFFKFKTKK